MDRGGATALMVASFKGHSSVVRKLLQAGATVNTANRERWTALHFAAEKEHEDVVELLLEAKADPELQTQDWRISHMLEEMMVCTLQHGKILLWSCTNSCIITV